MKKFSILPKRLTAFFMVLSLLLSLCTPAFAAESTTVTKVSGKAEIMKAATKDWVPAKVGDPVNAGDKIRVDGEGEAAVSKGKDDVKISVEKNTTVSYEGNQTGTEKFALEKGRVLVDVKKGNAVTTQSPVQTAAVRGTSYSQSYNPQTGLGNTTVFEGEVEVTDTATGETKILGPGESSNAQGEPSAEEATTVQGDGADTDVAGTGGSSDGGSSDGRLAEQDAASQNSDAKKDSFEPEPVNPT